MVQESRVIMMRLVVTLFLLPVLICDAQDLPGTVVTPSPVKPETPTVVAPPPAEEKAIPDAFPATRYEASWNKNPFLLKTAAIAQVQESWAKDYALTSLAEIDGVFRVSIKNKVTGESKRLVQGKEGDSEFKIVTVNLQPNKKESSVQISKGTETADLRYDETQMTVQARGAPGQPAAPRAGMPVMPGQTAANPVGSRSVVSAQSGGGGIPGRVNSGAQTAGRPAGYQPTPNGNPGISAPSIASGLPPLPVPPGLQGVAPTARSYSGTPPVSLPIPQLPTATGAAPSLTLGTGAVPFPPSTAPSTPTTPTTNTTDPATGTNPNAPSPVTRRRTLIPAPVLPQ